MIDTDAAEVALAAVRSLIEPDGGGIELVRTADDAVHLALVLDTAECAECVMPRAFLETVALDLMRPQLPTLERVVIDDPREQGGTGQGGTNVRA